MKTKQHLVASLMIAMKISLAQLMIAVLFVSTLYANNADGQKAIDKTFTLSVDNVKLETLIVSVQKATNVKFNYSPNTINVNKNVSYVAFNKKIIDFIHEVLIPNGIGYEEINNQIVLVPYLNKIEVATTSIIDVTIKGVVKDDKGEPLEGVTVSIKGTDVSAITDKEGKYSIKAKSNKVTLVFSFVGFQKVEVEASIASVVILKEQTSVLDDVVVVGYGTVKRKDLTGAVEKVNIGDLQKAPVRSVEEALGGRVAGVQVVSNDGQPGSPVSIVIRGNNSITQDNSPLYVIDGFPSENPDLNSINVSDIESIEVLKDASATAIYGARAANGVIIITTKQGKAGKTEISYNTYVGTQKIIKKMDLLSPYEFVRFQFEYDSLNTKAQYLTNGRTIENYRNAKGINWQDLLFRNAMMKNHELAIRGGNASTKFSLSSSIMQQEGIVLNSGYDRYQARFRLDHTISPKLKFGLNVNYSALKSYGVIPSSLNNSSSQTSNLMFSVWGYRPVSGDPNVDLTQGLDPEFELDLNDSRFNPLETVQNEVRNRSNNSIIANFSVEYKITKDLLFRSSGGITNDLNQTEEFNSSKTRSGSPSTAAGRINGVNGSISNNTRTSYVNENILSYNKKINKKNTLDALVGLTIQGSKQNIFGASATNLPNENLGLSGLDEGIPTRISSLRTNNTLASFLTRVNYSYESKYLVTFSFRSDGSSKFSPSNKWSYFPSGSVAWRISNEKFMKKQTLVNDAKFRFSYGVIGNNRVSDFAYLSSMASALTLAYPFNGQAAVSIVPTSLGNPDLKWETTSQANLGLDISFMKSAITLTVDVYRKVTTDLLLNAQLPLSSGFTTAFKNIGKVENKGIEFTINTKNIDRKNFTWSSSFNISFNRNRVLALNDNQESMLSLVNWDNQWRGLPGYITKVGQPLGLFYGAIWDGLYQISDFDKSASGVYTLKPTVTSNTSVFDPRIQPGHIKYRDLNGDRIINDDDLTIIGNANPKFIGGFSNNLKYKNFDINFFFQFSYGGSVLNANRLVFESNSGRILQNQFASVMNRWTPENQNNEMFVARGGGNRIYSSRVIEDGSYLRLKTVQIGYSIPAKTMKRLGMKSIRIYAAAQNLITWTNYTGLDPEVSAYNSALTPAFDYSVYPRAKTLTVGLNVNF
jgi:TonB-linked SusC/RagA family outer membrane protein